jgi:Leucine-rich repeat (LRR) protein
MRWVNLVGFEYKSLILRFVFCCMVIGMKGVLSFQVETSYAGEQPVVYQEEEHSPEYLARSLILVAADRGRTRLSLNGMDLQTLPPEIGLVSELEILFLYNNKLTTLPPELWELRSLKKLFVYRNQLTHLPPEVAQLTELEILDLRFNQIASLPSEIGGLASLRELELRGNQLRTLPGEIGNLTSLTTLDVGNNHLTSLPTDMAQLTALHTLLIDNNRLRTVPPIPPSLKNIAIHTNSLPFFYTSHSRLSYEQRLILHEGQPAFPRGVLVGLMVIMWVLVVGISVRLRLSVSWE